MEFESSGSPTEGVLRVKLRKFIIEYCLEIVDEVYDRGYSMTLEQVDDLYYEVMFTSIFLCNEA